jgi:glycosyltransferase involved in cell wall biosynthesis
MDVAEQFLNAIREQSPHSLAVVDTYDVHFVREMREAAIACDPSLKRKAERTKRRELEIYGSADLVLTVTEDDRRALLSESRKMNVAIVPNIHVLPEVVAPRSSRRDLVFVGGFTHRPNVDAVLYFCREILPLVQEQIADVKLYIVGNAPPAEVVTLGSERVIVTGYVANMAPYLNSALVSVIPLRFGSGMKGKIGEAMAYGLPSVTTSIGAEGMGLLDGVDALIADGPEEFAARIVLLYRDPEMWSSIAEKARIHVAREWSPEAVNRELSDILAKYCSTSRLECDSVK